MDSTAEKWWIEMEQRVVPLLVDLAPMGFVIARHSHERGWTDDPRCRLRRGVAEALCRARDRLPAGYNFKIVDGWRSWELQQAEADHAEREIRAAHPDWPDAAVAERVRVMAPRVRVVPRLASHRYGGAVDLTIVDAAGVELDFGAPMNGAAGPEAELLWYEFLDPPAGSAARAARDRRRLLIRCLGAEGFGPYLPEFWHWGMDRDLMA